MFLSNRPTFVSVFVFLLRQVHEMDVQRWGRICPSVFSFLETTGRISIKFYVESRQ
jgi:hypothetical protein